MKKLFLLMLVVICTAFTAQEAKVRIFIAGDSTAQTYNETKTLMRGWGQMLPSFFTSQVQVVNHAIGGRSTKSFLDEGRWDKLLNELKKGDYVLIQFGHNDTSSKPERHASPKDYRANLIRYVNDVRARKANPVLLTSVVMRTFVKGNLVDDRLKTYPGIMRQVAREMDVPLIDVNLQTRDMILSLGDEPSKALYMWVEPGEDPSKPDGSKDDTHLREEGARRVAEIVARGIEDADLRRLSRYLVR